MFVSEIGKECPDNDGWGRCGYTVCPTTGTIGFWTPLIHSFVRGRERGVHSLFICDTKLLNISN